MTPSPTRSLMVVLSSVVATVALSRALGAQQTGTPDVMGALLQEVHGLRVAMEQSAAIAPRVQLTLSRLNMEEQRIAQLSGQLDRARQDVTSISLSISQNADKIDQAEKRLATGPDEKERKDLEDFIRALKQNLKSHASAEQAARTRENDVAQALSTEQTRWIDLNARLDELERLMAPIR